jgi:hypothetical protein
MMRNVTKTGTNSVKLTAWEGYSISVDMRTSCCLLWLPVWGRKVGHVLAPRALSLSSRVVELLWDILTEFTSALPLTSLHMNTTRFALQWCIPLVCEWWRSPGFLLQLHASARWQHNSVPSYLELNSSAWNWLGFLTMRWWKAHDLCRLSWIPTIRTNWRFGTLRTSLSRNPRWSGFWYWSLVAVICLWKVI